MVEKSVATSFSKKSESNQENKRKNQEKNR